MKYTLTLFFALQLTCSFSQIHHDSNNTRVDSFIYNKMKAFKIPGLALAVIKNGAIVKLTTYGTGNTEWGNKVTSHSSFQIASCTKLLTSTLLLKALYEHKIVLDDYVSKYMDAIPASWKDLKIKHLITHSSGLKNFAGDLYLSTENVVRALKDSTLEYMPGKSQHYAQLDFMLLGYILEGIYKKPFPTLLKDEVTSPLGMNDGGFDMEEKMGTFMRTRPIKEKVPTYYEVNGLTTPYKFLYPQYTYTAGGYFASISDLSKWAIALDNEKLFPKAFADQYIYSRDSIDTKISQYTKVGWILEKENNISYAGHSGGPGLCDILRFPEEGYTFIVVSNDGELLPTFARAIASFYIKALPVNMDIKKFKR